MKRFGLLLAMVLVLTACGPAPTAATPDIPSTVAAVSSTMLAGTLTAQPSSTPVPTNTPQPTATQTPTDTPTATSSGSQTLTPTLPAVLAGPSATPWTGTFSPGNTDGLPTGLLQIQNNTGQPEITVTLNGTTTARQQPVYYSYKVTNSLNINIFWASYQYIVLIPGKRTMTGTFSQASKDKTTMRVDLTKVVIMGP